MWPVYHIIWGRPFLNLVDNTLFLIEIVIFHRIQVKLDLKLELVGRMSCILIKQIIGNFTMSNIPGIIKPCPGISNDFHDS